MSEDKTEPDNLTQEEWLELLKGVFAEKQLTFLPTQEAPNGILFDFCYGARVYFPPCAEEKTYHLKVVDLDSEVAIFDGTVKSGDYFVSPKHYYIRYGLQISRHPDGKRIFQHKMDLNGKDVFINFPVTTLGDTLAWYRAVELFECKHNCGIIAKVAPYIMAILKGSHPKHIFCYGDEIPLNPYAAYTMAIFHHDAEQSNAPDDYRQMPLHKYAGGILGVEVDELPCLIDETDNEAEIPGPYVCIATQASGGSKMWNHPTGWNEVVDFLIQSGYRVIDIDKNEVAGSGIFWHHIPRNAENFTGNKPLSARAELLRNADFFIGLGSGLSWLARCCGTPTVLISGFSEPWGEFPTPYRVINKNVCHGCFNDPRCQFESEDFFWCPRHKNTPRHWECQRGITPEMVIKTIKTIPDFNRHKKHNPNQK